MSEFDFIRDLRPLTDLDPALGLADDAALVPAQAEVVCTDTLVEGLHFIGDEPAADLAFKLLAVNASDLVAMNARPTHALLNLSLPGGRCDAAWRAGFITGLGEACAAFGLQLLGGDTTGSPAGLVLSATLFGDLEGRAPWRRADAEAGQRVCVSGPVGAGALGLADVQAGETQTAFAAHYRRPTPRLDLLGLPGVTACADISDGLIADLGHVCRASGVAAEVDLSAVPLADPAGDAAAQITGGDDYHLVFTVAEPSEAALPADCATIGRIIPAVQGQSLVRLSGEPAIVAQIEARAGYTHF
ncbi:MAG: thiamine-phosphate kinase [Alphaproteobacteria bacterium]|nr:thiamine-phosphate kinase [Alphaproteobacteria bacterium]